MKLVFTNLNNPLKHQQNKINPTTDIVVGFILWRRRDLNSYFRGCLETL